MIREKRPANVCREAFDYWEGAPSIISRSCSNTTWHPRYGFEISEPRALLTTQPLILEVWENFMIILYLSKSWSISLLRSRSSILSLGSLGRIDIQHSNRPCWGARTLRRSRHKISARLLPIRSYAHHGAARRGHNSE